MTRNQFVQSYALHVFKMSVGSIMDLDYIRASLQAISVMADEVDKAAPFEVDSKVIQSPKED